MEQINKNQQDNNVKQTQQNKNSIYCQKQGHQNKQVQFFYFSDQIENFLLCEKCVQQQNLDKLKLIRIDNILEKQEHEIQNFPYFFEDNENIQQKQLFNKYYNQDQNEDFKKFEFDFKKQFEQYFNDLALKVVEKIRKVQDICQQKIQLYFQQKFQGNQIQQAKYQEFFDISSVKKYTAQYFSGEISSDLLFQVQRDAMNNFIEEKKMKEQLQQLEKYEKQKEQMQKILDKMQNQINQEFKYVLSSEIEKKPFVFEEDVNKEIQFYKIKMEMPKNLEKQGVFQNFFDTVLFKKKGGKGEEREKEVKNQDINEKKGKNLMKKGKVVFKKEKEQFFRFIQSDKLEKNLKYSFKFRINVKGHNNQWLGFFLGNQGCDYEKLNKNDFEILQLSGKDCNSFLSNQHEKCGKNFSEFWNENTNINVVFNVQKQYVLVFDDDKICYLRGEVQKEKFQDLVFGFFVFENNQQDVVVTLVEQFTEVEE